MNNHTPIPPEFKELEDQLRSALKPEHNEQLDDTRREALLDAAARVNQSKKLSRRITEWAAVLLLCFLLIGMLLPSLSQPREKARQLSTISELKQQLMELNMKLAESSVSSPALAVDRDTSEWGMAAAALEAEAPTVEVAANFAQEPPSGGRAEKPAELSKSTSTMRRAKKDAPKAAYGNVLFLDGRISSLSDSEHNKDPSEKKEKEEWTWHVPILPPPPKHRPMITELTPIAYEQQDRQPSPLATKSPEAEPLSTFGIDTDNRSYIAARSALRDGQRPSPGDIRAEEFVNYFGNDTPEPRDGAVFNQSAQLARNPFRPENRFLAIGIRGKSAATRPQTGQSYTLLVDASGSMALPERWDNTQNCVKLLSRKLKTTGNFAVAYCNDSAERPGGGSTLTEQLRERLSIQEIGNAGNFLIITDGDDAPQEMAQRDELLNQAASLRTNNGSLNVFAVGEMSSPEFWEKLAEKGGGSLIGIDDPQTAQQFIDEELDARTRPIAEDVKIQLEFNPAAVRNYRLVGYAERAMRPEDFRNDAYRTSPVGSGQAVTAIYELTLQPEVKPETLLATLRTRYRNIDAPGVEELTMPITAAGADRDFTAMPDAFRNAVVAGEFAEYLKYPGLTGVATPGGMLDVLPKFQTGRNAELNELLKMTK